MRKVYKYWNCYDELPHGWKFDKTAGSPLAGYEFITNGKGIFDGRKRALCRVRPISQLYLLEAISEPKQEIKKMEVAIKKTKEQLIDSNYAKTLNELARARFKCKLLIDIKTDMAICEIEGWNKLEYINELIALISSMILNKLEQS